MNFDRHPIQGLYDAVASRGEPTREELDQLAADLTRDAPDTTTGVRRRIQETVDQIVVARDDGATGRARSIARDEGRALADQLGPYQPPRVDRPVEEIVAGIRRDPFDQRADEHEYDALPPRGI